jgi:AraC-type transcriptional regulator
VARPTIAAGYPKAFLEFAVSRGADRQILLERSGIRMDDLADQDHRVPLADYLALLEVGIELCNEPALSLLFGEAVRLPDISIVGLIGQLFQNAEDGSRQMTAELRTLSSSFAIMETFG